MNQHINIKVQVVKEKICQDCDSVDSDEEEKEEMIPLYPGLCLTDGEFLSDEEEKEGHIPLYPVVCLTDEEYLSDRDETVRELESYNNPTVFNEYFEVQNAIEKQRKIDLSQKINFEIDDISQHSFTVIEYIDFYINLIIDTHDKFKIKVPEAELFENMPKFNPVKILGSGCFGKAFLIVKQDEESKFPLEKDIKLAEGQKNLYVLKYIPYMEFKKTTSIGTVVHSDYLNKSINMEKSLGFYISHPNIFEFYGCYRTNFSAIIITEYLPCGTFRSIRHDTINDFYFDRMKFYSAQLILAIEYLHDLSIVHLDILDNNICIDHKGYAKLIDFGLAQYLPGKLTYTIGTCKNFYFIFFVFA